MTLHKSKAKFFRGFGFDENNLDVLAQGLIAIAQNYEVPEQTSTPHGKKYVVDGVLETPVGSSITVRTVCGSLKKEKAGHVL